MIPLTVPEIRRILAALTAHIYRNNAFAPGRPDSRDRALRVGDMVAHAVKLSHGF